MMTEGRKRLMPWNDMLMRVKASVHITVCDRSTQSTRGTRGVPQVRLTMKLNERSTSANVVFSFFPWFLTMLSASSRAKARARSSSVSHRVVRGSSGRIQKRARPKTTVIMPAQTNKVQVRQTVDVAQAVRASYLQSKRSN